MIGLILLGTAVFIPHVFAHAALVSAVPAPGSTVSTLEEIRLMFSEPIGPNGQIQLHQNFLVAAALEPVVENENELVTAVPPVPDGVYTVQWSVISTDGHTISGSYSLGIDSRTDRSAMAWIIGSALLIVAGGTAVWLRHKKQTAS
ncbi:MAG: copper-resistance exported protein [Ardenticatenaceae bacterium]|nr:MAG: copper-resistance exported protein [Ardenticatenaceae bacterium]